MIRMPDGKVVYEYVGDTSGIDKANNDAESKIKSSSKKIEDTAKSAGKSIGDEAEKTTSKTTGKLSGLASGAALAIGGAFTAATLSAAAFGKKGIELASDLNEVQNVVDTTFGQNAEKVNAWAKSAAENFGESELQAKKYASTLGAMVKSMGLTSDQTEQMSTKLAGLAGDFASFYNLDPDEAFEKIRAGISGETEPLKELGINMSDANLQAYALSQGMTTQVSKMTQAQQATLRYNYLLSVSKDAQGDFAKTSGSFANQQRILSMQFDSLAATVGQTLLPVLTETMGFLTKSLSDPAVSNTLKGFFEQISSIAQQALPGLLKAFGQLAPVFMQLVSGLLPPLMQTVSTLAPLIVSIAQEALPPLMDLVKMLLPPIMQIAKEVLPALGEIIKQLLPPLMEFWKTLLPPLLDIIKALLPPLLQIIQAVLPSLVELLKGIAPIMRELAPVISWLAGLIGDNLGAAFKNIEPIITGVMKILSGLIKFVKDVFKGDWKSAWEDIKGVFKGVWDTLGAVVKLPINTIIDGINSFIKGLDKVKVPDWVPLFGGKAINIPPIPKLAKGGLAFRPQQVVVGDNPNASVDPEVIAPLSKLSGLITQSLSGMFSGVSGSSVNTRYINNSVTKAPVQNFYGPVNLADKGSAEASLQQSQFLSPL